MPSSNRGRRKTTDLAGGDTYRRLRFVHGNNSTSDSDFYLWYESAAFIEDVVSDRSGFGPTFSYVSHSKVVNLQSTASAARSIKLNLSSHNTFYGLGAYTTNSTTYTGLAFESSHHNTVYGFDGHGINGSSSGGTSDCVNGGGDVQFFNSSDHDNLVVGGSIGLVVFGSTAGDSTNNIVHDAKVNCVRNLTAAASGNSVGAPGGPLVWGCTGTATSSQTLYMAMTPPGACTHTTYDQVYIMPPNANNTAATGVFYNFTCQAGAGGVNASSGVCKLLVNNVATGLTVTLGTSTSAITDTTHRYTYSAGDKISCTFTTQASETLGDVRCSALTQ